MKTSATIESRSSHSDVSTCWVASICVRASGTFFTSPHLFRVDIIGGSRASQPANERRLSAATSSSIVTRHRTTRGKPQPKLKFLRQVSLAKCLIYIRPRPNMACVRRWLLTRSSSRSHCCCCWLSCLCVRTGAFCHLANTIYTDRARACCNETLRSDM